MHAWLCLKGFPTLNESCTVNTRIIRIYLYTIIYINRIYSLDLKQTFGYAILQSGLKKYFFGNSVKTTF